MESSAGDVPDVHVCVGELPEMHVAPPGPRSRELSARLCAVESPAFEARRDARAATSGAEQAAIVYSHGHGANVFDVDGNRYVDLTAGFGAMVLGHPPNAASQAASAAMLTLPLALGDVYASELKVRACEALASLFPERGARVMLGLSGADAVTCALKTAVLATRRAGVIAFEGSYHGLSHGPLAACGLAPNFRVPFAGQLGDHVTFVPFPSQTDPRGGAVALEATLNAVRSALKQGDVGAILVEPMLGRGGCVVPPVSFLPALRSLADGAGALLLLDEVWTGMGRSGAMFAYELAGVVPDLVCIAKGLGAGIPISACVGRGRVMEAWGAHGGSTIHTGTHFGAPPACAAALETISALTGGLIERVFPVGDAFRQELIEHTARLPRPLNVRGQGLMVGIELADAAEALSVAQRLLASGFVVLTGGTTGSTITLSPPLVIAPSLLSAFVPALVSAVTAHRAAAV